MRLLFLQICLLIHFQNIWAQEVISSGGDFFYSSNGSLSWTVGETSTETISNSSKIFTQGFQQNYESILFLESITYQADVKIFPNPVNTALYIQWLQSQNNETTIELSDTYGKKLYQTSISKTNPETIITIDLSTFSAGIYYVILTDQRNVKPSVFKISKN